MPNGPMTIGIDARILTLREQRGMAQYLRSLLAVWPNARDEFVLFAETPPEHEAIPCPASIRWRFVPSSKGNRVQIWDWFDLPRAARREGLEVFWSPANRIFPFLGVPQVVTIHDTLLQEKVRFSDPVEAFYFRRLTPFLARFFADRIITISAFSQDRIRALFRYPERRIRVIHNGVDVPVPPFPSKEEARCHLRKAGVADRPFMYALGAEAPWKNTAGLIAAFDLVRRQIPDALLVISGVQDRAASRFMAMIRERGLEHHVRLMGFVPSSLRNTLYQAAEVFVYASLFEGFGLPPLEAMSLGTPVVASNATSIPEVIGDAALLVDARSPEVMADAIATLLSDAGCRHALQSRSSERRSRFSWTVSADEHRELLQGAIGHGAMESPS